MAPQKCACPMELPPPPNYGQCLPCWPFASHKTISPQPFGLGYSIAALIEMYANCDFTVSIEFYYSL